MFSIIRMIIAAADKSTDLTPSETVTTTEDSQVTAPEANLVETSLSVEETKAAEEISFISEDVCKEEKVESSKVEEVKSSKVEEVTPEEEKATPEDKEVTPKEDKEVAPKEEEKPAPEEEKEATSEEVTPVETVETDKEKKADD